ncbi:MAG: hypothetical protein K0S39_5808 [Paenibacillus sp.]|nr:hypothetical protein [Paenibacillus sp.]
MKTNSQTQSNDVSASENNSLEDGQAITREQLSDVYFAGTNDGTAQIANQTGYAEEEAK